MVELPDKRCDQTFNRFASLHNGRTFYNGRQKRRVSAFSQAHVHARSHVQCYSRFAFIAYELQINIRERQHRSGCPVCVLVFPFMAHTSLSRCNAKFTTRSKRFVLLLLAEVCTIPYIQIYALPKKSVFELVKSSYTPVARNVSYCLMGTTSTKIRVSRNGISNVTRGSAHTYIELSYTLGCTAPFSITALQGNIDERPPRAILQ